MSDPAKSAPTSASPDDLLNAGPGNAVELSEDALDGVAGGADDHIESPALGSTLTKQKASAKANAAIIAYAKG